MLHGRIGGMERVCEWCGKTFVAPTRGQPKRFCNQRCRKAANRAKTRLGVPTVLARKTRWVRHVRKRPVTISGAPASTTSPKTWATFSEANSSKVGDGLGFVLGGGVGCLDFDNVIDDAGQVDPRVVELVGALPKTWVEISPSGRGLHVWGMIPEAPGRVFYRDGLRIERYSRARYITVTRRPWQHSTLMLGDLSEVLEW